MGKEEFHARILHLYQILRHFSDEHHPLTTQQILRLMQERYHIQMHRVSVQKYVDILCACGISVNQRRAQDKFYYLEDRAFDLPELKLILDAVCASRFIPSDKTDNLVERFLTLTSDYNAERLRKNLTSSYAHMVKSRDTDSYETVLVLNEAIFAGKKVAFRYYIYNTRKEKVLRHNGQRYVVSPYVTLWNGDYYYLVGFYEARGAVNVFRADRIMAPPEILPEDAAPPPRDFDVSRYAGEVFRMYGTGKQKEVTLLCGDDMMMHVIDQFGLDVETTPIDENTFRARVRIDPSPNFYRWVFGFSGQVKIESPPEVLNAYLELAKKALE